MTVTSVVVESAEYSVVEESHPESDDSEYAFALVALTVKLLPLAETEPVAPLVLVPTPAVATE